MYMMQLIMIMLIMMITIKMQVRVKREESKGDLETKLNVVDNEERRLDQWIMIIIVIIVTFIL